MQLMKFRKSFGLTFTFVIASSLVTNSTQANIVPSWCDTKKVAAFSVLTTAIVSFVHLVTKKTQPVRVEPRSDATSDLAWFVFDELLVGQMEKGERVSKVVYNEVTEEFDIKYSKIEPRGVTGIIYSKMKPAIIPALTFMLLFNEDFKDKIIKSIKATKSFVNKPLSPLTDVWNAIIEDPNAIVAAATSVVKN